MKAIPIVMLLMFCLHGQALAEVTLVERGQARAVLLTADDPSPIAAYAAGELVEHVQQATGVKLIIAAESDADALASQPFRVYVGDTQAARDAGIDVDNLPAEAAVLRGAADAFYIVGREGKDDPLDFNNTLSGTLWGVYQVLDRDLGVRWLWPGDEGTHVPRAQQVKLQARDEEIQPHFARRNLRPVTRYNDPRIGFSLQGLKNYTQAERVFLRRHRMGRNDDPRPYTGHSFGSWWKQYGQEHPEWFQKLPDDKSVVDQWMRRLPAGYHLAGERRPDGRGPANPDLPHLVSMCVSNEQFQREIVRRWAVQREKRPDAIVRIGENDIPAFCSCDDCRALDDPQPTQQQLDAMPRYVRGMYQPFNASARYAHFWKSVHALASEIDPDVIVTAYVYMNYFAAPQREIELHPNIVLSFVPWLGWWMPRCEAEQRWVLEQWDRWRATGATMFYRPNYTLDGYAMPHVYSRQLAEVFQHYAANGAIAADFDSLLGQWAAQGPTMYLLARLHTRPADDVDALLQEYYAGFGPAADAVRRYFDHWERHTSALVDIPQRAVGTGYPGAAHVMFPAAAFDAAQSLLNQAALRVKHGPPIYRQRVSFLQDGLTHARGCAEVSRRFATDTTFEQRRDGLRELAAFRRSVEGRFIANYSWICRMESGWANVPGIFPDVDASP